jgi:hypothetical protein
VLISMDARRGLALLALATLTGLSWAASNDSGASNTPLAIRYDRDIRPLLSDRCFRCHGPDPAKRKAKMRLDLREQAVAEREGGHAIAPGHVEQSEMWRRINSDDPEERMPPPASNRKRLSADELALVRRWIDAGAEYEPHWSFVPPTRPQVPTESVTSGASSTSQAASTSNASHASSAPWCKNDVDRFILARLQREHVAPSEPASDETLLRRVFLDLTGLPPTLQELDAFLADRRADKYERWVDRLLSEEPYVTRYAERMAVPWLDAARYADTCGIHKDAGRSIWPWRDWVLAAYRDNMPFDRFLTEQLAGDLMPGATQAQEIASGFNRCHLTSDEGGAIPEEYLVEYAVDRAATTSSVFLGLTMGCARCHEHKFDPIAQEEFYGFYAFFNSIDEPGVYSQLSDPNRAMEPFLAIPSPAQKAEQERLRVEIAKLRDAQAAPDPIEDAERARFLADLPARLGIEWARATLTSARSTGGASLTPQADGSVLASGANPDQDEHVLTLRTDATGLRMLALEALTDPSLPRGRVGRAENGNAVVTGIEVTAISVADPAQKKNVRFEWAWADHEQPDGDFRAVNLLDASDNLGWAVDAHNVEGPRAALLVSDEPFGFAGGTELTVRVEYRSTYPQHALGRVRVEVGSIGDAGVAQLPLAQSGWYRVGPFPADGGAKAYETAFGPEQDAVLDLKRNFGNGNQYWQFDATLADGVLNNALPTGVNATYVARRVFAPVARRLDVSLGSDDGVRLYLDGREVFAKQIDRGLAADQDQVSLDLERGAHTIVFKVVNTGGLAGFYWRAQPVESDLAHDLVAALLPKSAVWPALAQRVERAWRLTFSPRYREFNRQIVALETEAAELDKKIPRTMVMKELAKPRETFVLVRGQYDHPDKKRPIQRGVPAALGKLPDGAPLDRLGLAQWMTSEKNPLVARVAVNRLWEMVFGTGIVRTSEDFGMQGEWPSHPDLLDWLAVELRESGWDIRHVLRLLVTSNTYRQSSRVRPELADIDPDDRLLASFPRKRLSAEQIRDQALLVSGLLVEHLGGPSVKPYQPAGLWEEVSMPDVNTRVYATDMGEGLWRRSLYTYWKRACPPPSMLTFDAPTREFCTIRRTATDTALQALVLWNDEQFVEAARVLAEHSLDEAGGERERLVRMFRRCTGRVPEDAELELLEHSLSGFRARYAAARADAEKLVATGTAPVPTNVDAAELAAWTMIASSLLNLDATIVRS